MSTSSWTLPAHASLLTSTFPAVHGATSMEPGLTPDGPLPRILRDAGYATQAMTTHVYLSKEYGLATASTGTGLSPGPAPTEVTDQAIRFLEAWAIGRSSCSCILRSALALRPSRALRPRFRSGLQGRGDGDLVGLQGAGADSIASQTSTTFRRSMTARSAIPTARSRGSFKR